MEKEKSIRKLREQQERTGRKNNHEQNILMMSE